MRTDPEPNDHGLFVHCSDGPVTFADLDPPDDVERVSEVEFRGPRVPFKQSMLLLRSLLDLWRELVERPSKIPVDDVS